MRPYKTLVLLVVLLAPIVATAQTAGQVMFVGYNADGTDGFSFVTFVDIASGTNIRFNDNEWNGTAFDADGTDGSMTWTTAASIPAGTVITINNSRTTPSASTGTVSGGTIDLDAANEVLYMFLGTSVSAPTTFLSAIANNGFSAANGQLPGTLSTTASAISISGNEDVMVYTGSTNCNSTVAACAAAVTAAASWTTQDTSADDSNNGAPDFPTNVPCDFFGTAMYPAVTYYSFATGAWNANTSWSLSADGSSGAVAAGVWPRRSDNVVIRSGHTITIDDVTDNKSACGLSPDGLPRTDVGPVASLPMFYQTGNILVQGTLTVSGVEIMVEGYTRLIAGSTCNLGSTLVNLGYLEVDAAAVMSGLDDMILSGASVTIINTSSTLADDLIIDYSTATLCGSGTTALTTNGGSRISYVNGAGVSQICTSFQVTCPNGGCTGGNPSFPTNGTGTFISGYTGPGGVGFSGNNKLWLKANDLSLANNAAVTSWADASGNSLTATATGATTTRPTFNTNSVNTTLPSISFDGGDFLNLGTPNALNFIPRTNNWSFLCAFNVNTGSSGTFLSKATSDDNNKQYQYTIDSSTPNRYTAFIGGDFHTGAATATGAWTVGMSTTSTNATTGFNTYLNGTADLTGQTVGDGSTTGTDVLIGARRNNSTTDFGFPLTGRIAEIAMYNGVLNTAQRMIVTNYLAAKYGITLVTANDVYTMDNSSNGNFDFDVAGIGQATDASNHRDARGSGIVRMWNASGMGDGEYLMWGHDGTILYSSTTAGVSAPIEERLSRTWRISETGDVGTVSVSFDISLLGTPLGSNLRLLIDRNGTNGFSDNDVTPIAGSTVGTTVVFSNVDFQNGDRFTLGNTDVDDPLPVELVRFRAVAEENTVRLSWSTASETNNDFFTVERSRNAQEWESVRRVPGAGTTKLMNHYEIVDDGPYRGASYYRLKQTDFDLQSKYSELVRVVVDHETPITLHPNPFRDHVRLLIDFEPEQSEVKLYNSNGVEVPFSMKKEGADLVITPGNIPQGLYILKVLDRFVIRTAKLIKTD
ncbi:T9SS type A sorting domain-containing protein [Fulvivirgaceae bacterium PWU4]|uniref:T9SS type A sorting domain-containing protein n=1 Tax=Chryseosolibacter histidini TaxID=2782349 RepID=A0AAP2DSQ1_9BACT|nr:T9SS type A sorting domain-containing protein [Chryseosolibacter histidini]MBT1699794.1 T9SS type A sorting domain-containing protein [Chryseosolibacter histidini]